jgi:hypothetical protein
MIAVGLAELLGSSPSLRGTSHIVTVSEQLGSSASLRNTYFIYSIIFITEAEKLGSSAYLRDNSHECSGSVKSSTFPASWIRIQYYFFRILILSFIQHYYLLNSILDPQGAETFGRSRSGN